MKTAGKNSFVKRIWVYKGRLLLILLSNILSVVFTILSFLVLEPIVKILFQGNDNNLSFFGQLFSQIITAIGIEYSIIHLIIVAILSMVILYFFKNCFQYLSSWLMAKVRSGVVAGLRNELYSKILSLPLSFFSSQKKGDIISRAVNDVQEIELLLVQTVQQLLTEPITLIFYLVTLFYLDYQLTLFILLLLPVVSFVISLAARSLRRRSRQIKVILGELISTVEETVNGIKVIKGSNAQEFSKDNFQKNNKQFEKRQRKILRLVDIASPLSEFLGVSVVMTVLVYGGAQVLHQNSNLTPSLFIVYIGLFVMIINPAKNISTAFSNFKRGSATFDRVNEILCADDVIIQKERPIVISEFRNHIAINNLSFAYRQQNVLHNLNLIVNKGERVALVGHSGSGKSTLADLLLRFYDVEEGEILIDGINLKEIELTSLRSLFCLVSQDVVLFNDTILNNIGFGLSFIDEDAVMEAAKIANADGFITQLPQGYHTNIGDRGLTLSGGQRQRISIARAILRNAPILILDEATSAMDTESEKLVQQAIDQFMENRTSIVIAHRLSTIKNADKIIVLDNGEIIETGTHEQLLAQHGKYAQLVAINSFQ